MILGLRCIALAVLVLACATPAMAQRGKWWQNDRFKAELGLTTEQSARLEEIFQKTLPTLRQRMHALDQAEEEFDRLVESADDASVMKHVEIVEEARAELNKARTVMLLRMRRTLTTDQWAKFTALAAADQRDRQRR
jgi:Spy/CpxP family protein refolding chaperone